MLKYNNKILGILTRIHCIYNIRALGDNISPMCADVQSKVSRCVLMQLRGGTGHFHIETGLWRQIPRELHVFVGSVHLGILKT